MKAKNSVRVVFNPNVLSNTGESLSKRLMVGKKLQSDIGDLLIQFRLHKIALTCDIKSMYRSIWLHPEDRLHRHILWRRDTGQPVQEFELNTVTFGLPPSPFQAQRVIGQLAS